MKQKQLTPLAISTLLSASSLVVGATISTTDANALGFTVLGSGSEVRSQIIASIDGPTYLAHHEKDGEEGKCGEGKCGEGKCGEESGEKPSTDDQKADKDGSESKCGEGSCG
jgi:uncharacterized low-complexity protein